MCSSYLPTTCPIILAASAAGISRFSLPPSSLPSCSCPGARQHSPWHQGRPWLGATRALRKGATQSVVQEIAAYLHTGTAACLQCHEFGGGACMVQPRDPWLTNAAHMACSPHHLEVGQPCLRPMLLRGCRISEAWLEFWWVNLRKLRWEMVTSH